MDMNVILEEVRRDVFERPKSTIDLDYLYSVRNEIQRFSDDTNSQLKKNVYQNYSLFIDSSREIATLKDEMKQLNTLLEQQLSAMNKLLDQLNKTPIIQTTIERPEPRGDIYGAMGGAESENDAEMLPEWFIKSPEDFDVLIAQRNLKEAVELAKKVKEHLLQYPKCCDNQIDLRSKVENRVKELINVISSELQPATDRSVQGGPRSSLNSIQLLQDLGLTSRAVKLYLDMRSSVLRFVLDQRKVETTTTSQLINDFFHNIIETCNEFKQAFGIADNIKKAIDECMDLEEFESPRRNNLNDGLLFDQIRPIFQTEHPKLDSKSAFLNGHDLSSQILNSHGVKVSDDTLAANLSNGPRIFQRLSAYSSLTYWITLEFEYFALLFREHVFNNSDLPLSKIADSIYYLRSQCSAMAKFCEIDMSQFIENELKEEIGQLIRVSERKLIETIKKLDRNELWQQQQFENKAEKTRFIEEMNDVDLKTMPKYISDDFKISFTASKTAFARFFLLIVNDLAKLVTPMNKSQVDSVLAKAFEIQMDSVIEALSRAQVKEKKPSQARFIKGNSNFLLDKVILVADERYTKITNMKCQKLADIRSKYQAKADQVAKL